MQLDVEVDGPLLLHHPFQRIKRELYVQSPPYVSDAAVNATMTRKIEYACRLDLEE